MMEKTKRFSLEKKAFHVRFEGWLVNRAFGEGYYVEEFHGFQQKMQRKVRSSLNGGKLQQQWQGLGATKKCYFFNAGGPFLDDTRFFGQKGVVTIVPFSVGKGLFFIETIDLRGLPFHLWSEEHSKKIVEKGTVVKDGRWAFTISVVVVGVEDEKWVRGMVELTRRRNESHSRTGGRRMIEKENLTTKRRLLFACFSCKRDDKLRSLFFLARGSVPKIGLKKLRTSPNLSIFGYRQGLRRQSGPP
ncbi:hypothetical protein AAG906_015200 [Vitis piasezkii]